MPCVDLNHSSIEKSSPICLVAEPKSLTPSKLAAVFESPAIAPARPASRLRRSRRGWCPSLSASGGLIRKLSTCKPVESVTFVAADPNPKAMPADALRHDRQRIGHGHDPALRPPVPGSTCRSGPGIAGGVVPVVSVCDPRLARNPAQVAGLYDLVEADPDGSGPSGSRSRPRVGRVSRPGTPTVSFVSTDATRRLVRAAPEAESPCLVRGPPSGPPGRGGDRARQPVSRSGPASRLWRRAGTRSSRRNPRRPVDGLRVGVRRPVAGRLRPVAGHGEKPVAARRRRDERCPSGVHGPTGPRRSRLTPDTLSGRTRRARAYGSTVLVPGASRERP